MDIKEFIQDWIDKSNTYDTENYLQKWHKDAVLNDPSVGKILKVTPASNNILKVIL